MPHFHKFLQSYRVFWLALCGVLSAGVYTLLYHAYPLLGLFARQRYVLKDYTGRQPHIGWALLLGLVLVFGLYALGLLAVREGSADRRTWAVVLLVPLCCGIIVFLTQSITSTDLYDYLFRGRMIAHFEVNTFITPPNQFRNDPLFPYVVWRNAVTAYGPPWEWMSWLASRLAGESPASDVNSLAHLLPLLLSYKALAALGYVLCAVAIWGALGRIAPEQRLVGLYCWLWNPMVLWETLAAGHNDVWLALPMILAAWAVAPAPGQRIAPRVSRPVLAFLALILGGLIKYLALLFGPLVLASSLRRLPGVRKRATLILLGSVLLCGLVVAAYAPFWVGPGTLINFEHRKSLYNASWLAALRPLIAAQSSQDAANDLLSKIAIALLGAGLLWATVRSFLAPERVIHAMRWLLVWFLFVANPWFQPWYVLWLLALVALAPQEKRLLHATLLLCFTGMLTYLAATFVLPRLGIGEREAMWHFLLSLLVYVPPLVVLLWRAPFRWTWGRGAETGAGLAVPGFGPWQGRINTLLARFPAARLWAYGTAMLCILVAFAGRYPLLPNAGGLADIGKLSGYGWPEFLGYVLGMAALWLLYFAALRESRRLTASTVRWAAFGFGALFAAAMVALYPVHAIDVFLYAVRSRLFSHYGVDPIQVPFQVYTDDPWMRFATTYWAARVSPYGPLWNLIAAPVTAVSGTNMLVAVLGFKLIMALATLGCGLVIMQIGRGYGAFAASGALGFVWNPLVLWEGIGNSHNDVLLLLLVLLALWAWVSRRFALVLPLLLLATLLKYVALPLVIVACVALWRSVAASERRRLLQHIALLSGLALAVGLAPFYNIPAMVHALRDQNSLYYTSLPSLAMALFRAAYPTHTIGPVISALAALALACVVVWQALRVWREPSRLVSACFEVFYVLLLVVASSRGWYIIWLVGLACVLPSAWQQWRAHAWAIGALAAYAVFIWLEAWLQPGPVRTQIAATSITIAPTLIVWGMYALFNRQHIWFLQRVQNRAKHSA